MRSFASHYVATEDKVHVADTRGAREQRKLLIVQIKANGMFLKLGKIRGDDLRRSCIHKPSVNSESQVVSDKTLFAN